MKLQDFLSRIREYDDKQLFEHLGIHDNFPILIKGEFEQVKDLMLKSGKYDKHSLENDVDRDRIRTRNGSKELEVLDKSFSLSLSYRHGIIIISPRKNVSSYTTRIGISNQAPFIKDWQTKNYTSTLMLQPYSRKVIPNTPWIRAVAIVLEDITSNILVPNLIPFCLPKVFNYKQGEEVQDFSTIVIWPDADEKKFNEMLRSIEK